jgi:hypothetical protein
METDYELVLEITGSSVAHTPEVTPQGVTSGVWATEEPVISNTISFNTNLLYGREL